MSDAIWVHCSRSSLVQVMPCCLTAPSLARINVFIRKVLDIHLRTIYGDVSWPSVTEIRLKFAHINLQWISGVNEIKIAPCTRFSCFPFLFQCFAWWNVFQELPSFTMETHLVGYVVCDWYFHIQWNFMTCLMIPVKSYQKWKKKLSLLPLLISSEWQCLFYLPWKTICLERPVSLWRLTLLSRKFKYLVLFGNHTAGLDIKACLHVLVM